MIFIHLLISDPRSARGQQEKNKKTKKNNLKKVVEYGKKSRNGRYVKF